MTCRYLLLLALPLLTAADWPQFLGPTRDGASAEVVPVWKDAPKVLWKQPVGEAHSSPVVAGGVVYAFYKPAGKDADALAAFDAKTGEKLWEKSYDRAAFTPKFGVGPRSTPAVHGGKVYTLGNTGVLACWDAKTGTVNWKVDTLEQFQADNLYFGVSTSPVVADGKVIVMVGGKKAGIVAFDAATGKTAWQATDDPSSYSSPLVTGTGESARVIALTGSHLRAVSLAGKPLWAVPFKDLLNESSTTPVVAGDLVIGSSVTAGSIALKGTAANTPTTAWKNAELSCYFSTPVAVGPHLYMVNGGLSLNPTVTLRCVETATGKVLWAKPKVGKYHAALVKTGDDKLLMLDDAGRVILIQPDPAGYKELSRAQVCGTTWAHPAVADGVVYVRDEKELVAVRVGE